MLSADLHRCLALLREVETILLRNREGVLAAHLSLVTGRLRGHVAQADPLI